MIITTGRCVNSQIYQIKTFAAEIPYWQRDHVGSAIKRRFNNVVGGDIKVVNFALRKLGVALIN